MVGPDRPDPSQVPAVGISSAERADKPAPWIGLWIGWAVNVNALILFHQL